MSYDHTNKDYLLAFGLSKDEIIEYIKKALSLHVIEGMALSKAILVCIGDIREKGKDVDPETMDVKIFICGMLFNHMLEESKKNHPMMGLLSSLLASTRPDKDPEYMVNLLKDLKNSLKKESTLPFNVDDLMESVKKEMDELE